MARDLHDFIIAENELFTNSSFRDIGALKSFLSYSTKSEGEELPKEYTEAAFLVELVNIFLELRFHAEEKHQADKGNAVNERDALPLSDTEIAEVIFSEDESEPSPRLVSRIAQDHLFLIERLLQKMRRVLQRERKRVHLSEAQEIDAHCLRWLTVQPGITASQKAGASQRIMAVVRKETHNTLENRVLKDFLQRVHRLSTFYLLRFKRKDYEGSERLNAVRRLNNVAEGALKMPQMAEIAPLNDMPVPNYVLRCDSLYGKMWGLYRRVVEEMHIVELSWKRRHLLFAEMVRLYILACFNKKLGEWSEARQTFDSTLWIKRLPNEEGFIDRARFDNIYELSNKIIAWKNPGISGMQVGFKELSGSGRKDAIKLAIAYLTQTNMEEINVSGNTFYIVFSARKIDFREDVRRKIIQLNSLEDIGGADCKLVDKINILLKALAG